MKKIQLFLVTLFATLSVVFAQDNNSPYFSKNFAGQAIKDVVVETSGGYIKIYGGNAPESKVEMFVSANNWNGKITKEEIAERLKTYLVRIEREGDKLLVSAKPLNGNTWGNGKNSLSISFVVSVPEATSSVIKTSGGSLVAKNLNGNQTLSTSGGSITLDDLEGDVRARTSGGSLAISNCRKRMDAATSGGSIRAENTSGAINLTTSGGSLDLSKLSGSISARTSGGSVEANDLSGESRLATSGGSMSLRRMSGGLEASTSGGTINAEITELGKFLTLSTSSGSIDVKMPTDKGMDLDLRGSSVKMEYKNFDGQTERNSVRGRMNGGGIPVRMTASSQIRIN